MRKRFSLLIAIVLGGCVVQPQATRLTQPAMLTERSLTIAGQPSPMAPAPKSRNFKLRLTLDSPSDLRVKQGDAVVTGQLISDRRESRQRIEKERRFLRLQLSASPPLEPSYSAELAKIQAAKTKIEQARLALQRYRENLPYTELAWNKLPLTAERNELQVLQAKLITAETELSIAQGELQQSKDQYQQKRRETQAQSLAQSQVRSQLQDIEGKIANLSLRSPNTGTIKKVKWLGQTDQELQVEVTLAVKDAS